MTARAPSALAATLTVARLTIRRALRDRSTILVIVLSMIPVVFILLLNSKWQPDNAWGRVLNVSIIPLFAIIPPLVLAPLIAEEASARTYSYLWSRPIPRWTVVAGKALVLVPLVTMLFSIAAVASWMVVFEGGETHRITRALPALAAGTLAAGAVSAAIGVFLHKYATATAAGYLLVFDLQLGRIPASVSNLSITHHIREFAGAGSAGPAQMGDLIWLAGIASGAVALMLWRLRHLQLAASS